MTGGSPDKMGCLHLMRLFLSFSDFLLFTLLSLSSPHPWALPPPPGADEVPAQHVRSTGPRDSMRQSSARARPPLMCHLDPCPSLPQGERAGDATRIHEGLRRCLWNYEECSLPPSLGSVLRHPSPAGLPSFPLDPQLDAQLWSGTAEWPWLHEATSSTNLEGCVCWGRVVRQTPSPGLGPQGRWDPGRRQPPVSVWREPGLSPAYMILGQALTSADRGARESDFAVQLARQGTTGSSEDPAAPGLRREVVPASGWPFRL
uniref:Uncharacterized protein n=1 Tax=Myotis myotis TaxID=51298 RepID=A0A7J7T2U7_MYOMY|nr:hypothetical protein mMyoMyo1_000154 [Myotis myotis]